MPENPAAVGIAETSNEKSFYLEEFRGHTLCISLRLADAQEDDGKGIWELIGELVSHGVRVLALVGCTDMDSGKRQIRRNLRKIIPSTEHITRPATTSSSVHILGQQDEAQIEKIWHTLRSGPICVAVLPARQLLLRGQQIAGRLRIHKWVIAQEEGGLFTAAGIPVSFMDDSVLTESLRRGAAEWAGFKQRRATLRAIQKALRDGVAAVNLCSLDNVATELFTYEGAGTLFTLEDYCRVERLGIDDYAEVEKLLARGNREGFLKKRSRKEIDAVLLNGFGATIGSNHLAGVCALLTEEYKRARAGEIAGLYTLTRFKSEGVGGQLLTHLAGEAKKAGLNYLFACTTSANAVTFFERHDFRQVRKNRVPAAKWHRYPSEREKKLTLVRRDLD